MTTYINVHLFLKLFLRCFSWRFIHSAFTVCDDSMPTTMLLMPEEQPNPRALRFKLSSRSLVPQTQVSTSDVRHDTGNVIPCSKAGIDLTFQKLVVLQWKQTEVNICGPVKWLSGFTTTWHTSLMNRVWFLDPKATGKKQLPKVVLWPPLARCVCIHLICTYLHSHIYTHAHTIIINKNFKVNGFTHFKLWEIQEWIMAEGRSVTRKGGMGREQGNLWRFRPWNGYEWLHREGGILTAPGREK